ncbi:serine-threonine protein kinase, putative [Bodo saltans]|uniref:Serine-threonine protein kinase, putative n=1 Tax=Bodo saltans TaxID=75058 RepID=A0A0S4J2K6_BODSA|nr:serine-threonine protein kinase, putative [Bodo saltans]|eukprot:CUG84967.1 serine-threonine protein kinase, putative [Bodo saltans]
MSQPSTQPASVAPAASAASATDAGAAADQGTSSDAERYVRPAVALSVNVMTLYKGINKRYCEYRRQNSAAPRYNGGYDDREGHYVVMYGEEVLDRYTVQEVLGKGSFGTVVRAFDSKYQEPVAMKISRSGNYFYEQGKLEVDIVLKLNNKSQLNDLVVKIRKVFIWKNHIVLVFELLSFNLYQLIKCTKFNGVSLDLTRKFAYQLLQVLRQLEQHKPPIIHCDLKPENVLLRDQHRSGIRVIDFGSACYYSAVPRHKYIQSRFYRSPEVILELPYNTAIDRWSLGCMLVELHVGTALFPGKTEIDQLVNFTQLLGPLPDEMVGKSPKKDRFYSATDGSLKTTRTLTHDRLANVIGVRTGGPRGSRRGQEGHDEETYGHFLDFVERLLKYDPAERMSCEEAFQHPFLAPLLVLEQQHLQMIRDREAAAAAGEAPAPSSSVTTSGPPKPTPKSSSA